MAYRQEKTKTTLFFDRIRTLCTITCFQVSIDLPNESRTKEFATSASRIHSRKHNEMAHTKLERSKTSISESEQRVLCIYATEKFRRNFFFQVRYREKVPIVLGQLGI